MPEPSVSIHATPTGVLLTVYGIAVTAPTIEEAIGIHVDAARQNCSPSDEPPPSPAHPAEKGPSLRDTSYYVVIRYVPDPIADEAVNFGVAVFRGADVQWRFLRDWSRVDALSRGRSTEFLRDFVRGAAAMRPAEIQRASREWTNSIQITPPRASMVDIESTLEMVAARMLFG